LTTPKAIPYTQPCLKALLLQDRKERKTVFYDPYMDRQTLVIPGESDMRTSITTILFGISILSILYTIVSSFLQERKARGLRRWGKEQHPNAWNSLPWIVRKIMKADIGLQQIHSAQLIDDAYFKGGYAVVQKYNKHIWLSLLGSLLLLIIVSIL
jgi:hypothetical protein